MKEMNQAQNLSGAILFFFICLFVYTKLAGPIPFTINSIQTTKNIFTVQGVGEEKAIPDTAMVSLSIMTHAATMDDAKNQMNQITNQVVTDLKALGIAEKDIKTTNFSVYPDPNVTPEVVNLPAMSQSAPVGPKKMEAMIAPISLPVISQTPKTLGAFIGTQSIEVTTKSIDLANKAIDIASKDGATSMGAPNFIINDDKRKELTKKARVKAIADAKEKAKDLANDAGMTLGKIIDIQQSDGGGNFKYAAMDSRVGGVAMEAPTQLNPGENTVSVTVTLSYETL